MNKRIVYIVLALLTVAQIFTPGIHAFAANTPTISVSDVSGRAGDEVSVTVDISNNPGIICLQLSIVYDHSCLELVNVSDKSFFKKNTAVFSNSFDASPFVLSWNDSLSTENYSNNGCLALLTFKIKAPIRSNSIPIRVVVEDAFDKDLLNVAFHTVDGKIGITSTTNPEPTTTNKPTTTTKPSTSVAYTRLSGKDRIATAIEISKSGWNSASTVVLADGYNYADALAGVPLAYAVDAPILLTGGEVLESNVLAEISRLKAKNVYILGGTAAISSSVESKLRASGITIIRLKGNDRYETAIAIAKELSQKTDGKFTELFFASAENFPDALAISSVAALQGNPILYMPKQGTIKNSTASYIKSTGCKKGTILGGNSAISSSGADSLSIAGLTVSRVYGPDRYETALAICNKYSSVFKKGTVCIATGTNFPDALAGASFAAKSKSPILLVSSNSPGNEQIKFVKSLKIKKAYVFGGENAVSNYIVDSVLP